MNTEALFLFLILLLGLVLCSFLGGNCGTEGFTGNFSGTFNFDGNNTSSSTSTSTSTPSTSGASTSSSNMYDNYNHYSGTSTQLSPGTTFYGPNNVTASVITNSDGTQSLQIILPGSSTPVTFTQPTDASGSSVESYINYLGTVTTYNGPNGNTATVVQTDNGQQAIKVTTPTNTYYYYQSGTYSNTTDTSTQYYGSTGSPIQQAPNTLAYQNNGVSVASITGPQGNSAYYAQGPAGNAVVGTTTNTDYSSTLPPGIPKSQIPPGQEDLYILKSQVVPPVCPACPSNISSQREKPCPPCPACARCPEPAFDCKKVPNYSVINDDYSAMSAYANNYYQSSSNQYMPAPVLSDFSQFGM